MKNKKIISISLSVILLLNCFSLGIFANSNSEFNYIVLSEQEKTAELVGYTGQENEVTVPSVINGYTIVSAFESSPASENGLNIKKIVLPNTVAKIGERAFSNLINLEEITLPSGIHKLSNYCFYNCRNLKNITIPNDVTEIGENCFSYCYGLENIQFNDGLKRIGNGSFMSCIGITDLAFPTSLVYIGNDSFKNCISLSEIYFPYGLEIIGNGAFSNCTSLNHVTVPPRALVNENAFSGTGIDGNAYLNHNLPFNDVARDTWYYIPTLFSYMQGYISGYQDGTFGPQNNILRQDFVVMLANISKVNLNHFHNDGSLFPDVPADEYYSNAVKWAIDNRILSGYQNGYFGVGDSLTREQVCVILYNYVIRYLDKNLPATKTVHENLNSFPDYSSVSAWALNAVSWAVEYKIISGVNGVYLSPSSNVNRAQIVTIIYNMKTNGII